MIAHDPPRGLQQIVFISACMCTDWFYIARVLGAMDLDKLGVFLYLFKIIVNLTRLKNIIKFQVIGNE